MRKWRHELVDIQERVPEEMSQFSQNLELEEIVRIIETNMKSTSLLEKLFIIADLVRSPDPIKLRNDAEEIVRDHPLSALFSSSHLDRHGKTIKRGSGGLSSEDNIADKIAQGEMLRRKLQTAGQIEPAIHLLNEAHHLSDHTLVPVLQQSPFVPREKLYTFAKGFSRFFQGDMISAVYIIAPLVESMLRHVLIMNNYDVTNFDEATLTQEDKTISSMLDSMRPELNSVFTPAIVGDIESVFLDKRGPYLRHSVAHGLLGDFDPFGADAIYACALIYRICMIPLFGYKGEIKEMFAGSQYYSAIFD